LKLRTLRSRLSPYFRVWFPPLGVALIVVLYLAKSIPFQDVMRSACFDLYQTAAPRERVSAPVVIVDIDEASLKQYGQWPWPRSLLAQLLGRIDTMNPAAVALDIIMPEADRSSPCEITKYIPNVDRHLVDKVCSLPSNDELMAGAMRQSRVVLGIAGIDGGAQSRLKSAPIRIIGKEPKPFMRHFDSAILNVHDLQQAATGHAILSADMDRGVIRRVPLVASVGNAIFPSLSLEILRLAAGSPFFDIKSNAKGIEGVGVGDLFIPTQADGSTWVHYGHHDPARFVSARKILNGTPNADELDHKLVLIGVSGLGLVDYPSTALGERIPGVEVHAQVLESIFDGTLLLRPYWASWAEAGAIVLMGLLLIYGFPRIKARVQIPIAVCVLAILAGTGFVLFTRLQLLLDVATPIAVFTSLYLMELADSLIREEAELAAGVRERERISRTLERYVSKGVATELLRAPGQVSLAGVRRELTVLFVDLAGFTSLAEKLSPEEVVAHLNEYFEAVCSAILEEDGTVKEFQGDGVVAFWGAPMTQPDHARRACRAALGAAARLDEMCARWVGRGILAPNYRMGLHTAELVAGEVGSAERSTYGVVGDGMNLASRLEGVNKVYGTHILISEATHVQLGADFVTRELDLVRVVGRRTPVRIFELIAIAQQASAATPPKFGLYAEALAAYRAGDWDAALRSLAAIAVLDQNDKPARVLAARCEAFRAAPPDDWNGVFALESK
jgi:CHASE2 domain-containing sensor protein/class 3 adenylate cyclase